MIPPAQLLGAFATQVRALAAAAAGPGPSAFHCFSSSALLVYDGAAPGLATARPRVRLVDFAHAFPGGAHGGGPDGNLAAGLAGLAGALEAAAALG